jgi:hypothetical protein
MDGASGGFARSGHAGWLHVVHTVTAEKSEGHEEPFVTGITKGFVIFVSSWRDPFQKSTCPPTLNKRPASTAVGRRNWLLAVVENVVLMEFAYALLKAL